MSEFQLKPGDVSRRKFLTALATGAAVSVVSEGCFDPEEMGDVLYIKHNKEVEHLFQKVQEGGFSFGTEAADQYEISSSNDQLIMRESGGSSETMNRNFSQELVLEKEGNGFKIVKYTSGGYANGSEGKYTSITLKYVPSKDGHPGGMKFDGLDSSYGNPTTKAELNAVAQKILKQRIGPFLETFTDNLK